MSAHSEKTDGPVAVEDLFLSRRSEIAPAGAPTLDLVAERLRSAPMSESVALAVERARADGAPGLAAVSTSLAGSDADALREELAEHQAEGALLSTVPADSAVGARPKVTQPLQVQPRGADPRWIADSALAAGFSSVAGGAITPLGDGAPDLATRLERWRYVDQLAGALQRRGVDVHRALVTPSGTGAVPPGLACAWSVLEALLGAEQGVRHVTVGQRCTFNLDQDVAAARTARAEARRYLDQLGHADVAVRAQLTAEFGLASQLPARAAGAMGLCALAASLAAVDVFAIDARVTGPGASPREATAHALHLSVAMIRMLRAQPAPDSEHLDQEQVLTTRQCAAIVDRVLAAGDGELAAGLVVAMDAGWLGFGAGSSGDALEVTVARDARGALRLDDVGRLPLDRETQDLARALARPAADPQREPTTAGHLVEAFQGTPLEGWTT